MSDKQLLPGAIQPAEQVCNRWRVTITNDTSNQDVVKPVFWGHIAKMLRSGDVIEVLSDDQTRFMELLVLYSRRTEACVAVLREQNIKAAAKIDEIVSDYQIVFRGQRFKYGVMRGKDVVKDGFETEDLAKEHLSVHLKNLAA